MKFDNLQNRDENTLKFKRLFIGGLYKDVSKDELRYFNTVALVEYLF